MLISKLTQVTGLGGIQPFKVLILKYLSPHVPTASARSSCRSGNLDESPQANYCETNSFLMSAAFKIAEKATFEFESLHPLSGCYKIYQCYYTEMKKILDLITSIFYFGDLTTLMMLQTFIELFNSLQHVKLIYIGVRFFKDTSHSFLWNLFYPYFKVLC